MVPTLEERVREFALSLPGAVEEYPWGERVAKAGRKVFVFLGLEGSKLITVKLRESHGHAMAIDGAAPTGYGLGRSGWVNVPVLADGVTFELLCDWIEESYRIVAPKRLVAELDARD
jgi:predicted DNA-binding protein (MmcQ/YjbR family)